MKGIKNLEYRGYDSAGAAAIVDGQLRVKKEVGKVALLESSLAQENWQASIAIAHTRWATHGSPTLANAHPHYDAGHQCVVVHNGIIENDEALRTTLKQQGIIFASETDTEVISQLIGTLYRGNLLEAVQAAVPYLHGAFAIAVVHQAHPDELIVVAQKSPLCIGVGEGEMFVASDPGAFVKYTRRAMYLHGAEVARLTANTIEVFNEQGQRIMKPIEEVGFAVEDVSKGQFPHYMLKEIYEQPQTIQNALLSRLSADTAHFEGCHIAWKEVQHIIILACGTSYHAGLIAAYMLEEYARLPVHVEVSSEFRTRTPIVLPGTLVVAVSQSGETADTLAAMRELKGRGAQLLGICNVQGSTMAREVDHCLFLRAGPEVGVASTKAFTSQLVVLTLMTLQLARLRGLPLEEGEAISTALRALPAQVQTILAQRPHIQAIARRYHTYDHFFYLGRRYMFPTALEGALKLKEIAYVNANGYPAGEMKHGPIALIDPQCPTVACMGDRQTFSKMLSNLREVKARHGKVIALSPTELSLADDVILIPQTRDELSPILTTLATQLLAYEIAILRNCEIDQPRNLAKSVTVE